MEWTYGARQLEDLSLIDSGSLVCSNGQYSPFIEPLQDLQLCHAETETAPTIFTIRARRTGQAVDVADDHGILAHRATPRQLPAQRPLHDPKCSPVNLRSRLRCNSGVCWLIVQAERTLARENQPGSTPLILALDSKRLALRARRLALIALDAP